MKPEPRVRADVSFSLEDESDRVSVSEARLLGFKPSVTVSAGGKGSIRAELRVENVTSDGSLPA
jgi:hypothetical protein